MNAGEFVVIGVSWRHLADSNRKFKYPFTDIRPRQTQPAGGVGRARILFGAADRVSVMVSLNHLILSF